MKRTYVGIGVGALVLGALGACSTSITGDSTSDGSGGGATTEPTLSTGTTPTSESSTGDFGGSTGLGGSIGFGGSTSGDGGSPIGDGGSSPGSAQPPGPGPSSPGDGSGAVFAISKVLLGDTTRTGHKSSSAWKLYGYDVDHQITNCTGNACSQITDHCKPSAGGNPAFVYPDGHDGIDNSFGTNILPILLGIEADESTLVNQEIASGDWTKIFDLEGLGSGSEYNPLTSRLYVGANLGHAPLFDGTDAWPVRPEGLTDPSNITTSKEVFAASYVVDNTWVSGVGQITFPLALANVQGFNLDIQHAQITFEMSADHTLATNGTISGLIPTEELVNEFVQAAGSFDQSLCSGGTIDSIKSQIRQASDIMKDGSAGTHSQTCDAVSIGLGFAAQRVTLGGVGAPTPPNDPCN